MTITVQIGTNGGPLNDGDVSNWVRRVDLWLEDFTVGRFSIILDNAGQQAEGLFLPQEATTITVDGVAMMKGWVDDAFPVGLPNDDAIPVLEVTGRDYSRRYADLFHTADYSAGTTRIDDIIAAVNTASGSGINYVSPGTAPYKPYVFKRTYLQDGFKDLCVMADYLYYVDSITNILQVFAVASPSSTGVTLRSVASDTSNNILRFRKGEKLGFDIRNYIYVEGPPVNDHWTEGNSADLTGENCTLTNDTTVKIFNGSSVKCTVTAPGSALLHIAFPLYEYSNLDFSEVGSVDCSFFFRHNHADALSCTVRLEDNVGAVIYYAPSHLVSTNTWYKFIFPVGVDNDIAAGAVSDQWYYVAGANFDWSNIVKLSFFPGSFLAAEAFYVDGLNLPSIQAISIEEDAGSQGSYLKRMIPLSLQDAVSQKALDNYASSMLAKYISPLETLECVVSGSTSLKFTGQTVSVLAPNIATVTYRIQSLHIIYGDDVEAEYGSNFVDELKLIKQTI